MNTIATLDLLRAALDHRLNDLAARIGVSAARLADTVTTLLDDVEVTAAHPVECRRLRARRDLAQSVRGRRVQATMPGAAAPSAPVLTFPTRQWRTEVATAA